MGVSVSESEGIKLYTSEISKIEVAFSLSEQRQQALDAEAERGIKASPGIPSSQLLPHEGGEFSEEERDLQAILKTHEEWKEQRAAAFARIEEARHDKELQERYGPDLYQAYKSGRYSQSEADGLASRYSVTLTGKVE